MRISFPSWRRRQKQVDVDPILSMFPSEAALTPLSQEVVAEAARHARTRLAGSPRASITGTDPELVTVAAVLTRRVPVSWIEGVAVVEAAVAQVADGPIPDSSGVILNADGTIELRGGRSNLGVEQFARTLHALVSSEPIPAPLRLLISKWITPEDPRAVKKFATELSYFARPDGAALIRAVYERYLATPEPAALVEAKATPPPLPPKPEQNQKRAMPAWVAVALAVVAAGVGGAWISSTLQSKGGGGAGRTLKSIVASAQTALGVTSSSAPSTDASAPATATSADAPATPSNPKSVAIGQSLRRPLAPPPAGGVTPRLVDPNSDGGSSLVSPAILAPFSAAVVNSTPSPPPSAPLSGLGASASAPAPAAAAFASPTATLETGSNLQRLYTTGDADVQPPQMIYPSLPPVLSRFGDTNTMEVVVSQQGSVERVRLVSAARRMTDMMLLSGAKTWRFLPAVRDGQPVRYRMTVTWSATP